MVLDTHTLAEGFLYEVEGWLNLVRGYSLMLCWRLISRRQQTGQVCRWMLGPLKCAVRPVRFSRYQNQDSPNQVLCQMQSYQENV